MAEVSGNARILAVDSPLVAEAKALKEAVTMAANLDLKNVTFESDSLILVLACNVKSRFWDIGPWVHKINTYRSLLQNAKFVWMHREAITVAHEVAALNLKFALPSLSSVFRPVLFYLYLDFRACCSGVFL